MVHAMTLPIALTRNNSPVDGGNMVLMMAMPKVGVTMHGMPLAHPVDLTTMQTIEPGTITIPSMMLHLFLVGLTTLHGMNIRIRLRQVGTLLTLCLHREC